MKKTICILLTILMLVSCLPSAAFADADYATGSPWLDPEIPGNVTEETEADLKDNFALAVNKEGYLTTAMADGYGCGGTMIDLYLMADENLTGIFAAADPSASHDADLAISYYNLLLDWDTRNALGMEPILDDMEAIRSLDSIEAMNALFTETPAEDLPAVIIEVGVDGDLADASVMTVYIGEPSLLLGNSLYYREESQISTTVRREYSELMRKALVKAGYEEDEAQALLDTCLAFETELAAAVYSSVEKNSSDYISRVYNPMTIDEADALCGGYPLTGFLQNIGFVSDRCVVENPAALEIVAKYYTEEHLETLKAYLMVHLVMDSLNDLDRECYDWVIACSNAISGTEGTLPDDVKAANTVSKSLGWAVARMYADTYVTVEDKTSVRGIIDEVVEAYREMLLQETFISEETRAYAVEKLDKLTVRCLYPDDWSKYDLSSIDFAGPEEGGTLKEANRAISRYQINAQLEKLENGRDTERWPDGIYPHTVNCFYSPTDNSVNILAAFARGEVYYSEMTREQLMGSLGVVIGHEISHAFDASGSQFDASGNRVNWWTEEDYAAFAAMNQKLADYFSGISVWEGTQVNGDTLTKEACADMGAVACMLSIASGIEGFDYDAFFRTYANTWLFVQSATMTQMRILNDSHPLAYLRINAVLQQFREFSDCYGITEGDGMYLSEADRVAIW